MPKTTTVTSNSTSIGPGRRNQRGSNFVVGIAPVSLEETAGNSLGELTGDAGTPVPGSGGLGANGL